MNPAKIKNVDAGFLNVHAFFLINTSLSTLSHWCTGAETLSLHDHPGGGISSAGTGKPGTGTFKKAPAAFSCLNILSFSNDIVVII